MNLSELQRDALAEMANISASRAAKQLSQLLEDSIEIRVPEIELLPLSALRRRLVADEHGMACVYQDLEGALAGRVHLVFHDAGSRALVQALVGQMAQASEAELRAYEHEAMTEVGNIIISTFAAMLADLLKAAIRLTIPYYAEGSVEQLLFAQPGNGGENVVIVIETMLRAAHRDVSGTLMVVLTMHSAESLLRRLDDMIQQFQTG